MVDVDDMFSEDVRNDDQRFNRVENAVLDIKRDFASLKPKIDNLLSVETELQDLVTRLDELLYDEQPAAAPTAITPAPMVEKKAKWAAPAKSTKSASGRASVNSIRFGQHKDKIRAVLDLTANSNYSIDLDNNEKFLIVELPNTQWNAAASKNLKLPLIKSYSTQPLENGSGTRLIVSLSKGTTLLKHQKLKASAKSNDRIYFDLAL